MSRKSKSGILLDNFGGQAEADADDAVRAQTAAEGTDQNQEHTSMVMLERVILRILRTEVDRISQDTDALTRFLRQFFGAVIIEDELAQWAQYFVEQTPRVQIGYPNDTSHFPCVSIILESDEESTKFVGNYAGMKLGLATGDDADYVGSFFAQTFGLFIYAQNPDGLGVLYHIMKAILLGGQEGIAANGAMDLHLSGGELSPQDVYLPNNMFCRVLRVSLTAPQTVERLRRQPNYQRTRITGIHASDVVVDGARGGVHHSPQECE